MTLRMAAFVLCALCRFSDAGNDTLTARSGGRRPKTAKARNRGRCEHRWCRRLAAAPCTLWGFGHGAWPEGGAVCVGHSARK